MIITSCQKQPTSDFSISSNEAVTGEIIYFTNNSTNADNYKWDFGDGLTSSDKNTQHSYADGGTFQVKLTAFSKNGNKDDEKITTININETCKHCKLVTYTYGTLANESNYEEYCGSELVSIEEYYFNDTNYGIISYYVCDQ